MKLASSQICNISMLQRLVTALERLSAPWYQINSSFLVKNCSAHKSSLYFVLNPFETISFSWVEINSKDIVDVIIHR